MTERDFAKEVVAKLQQHGYTTYWAGGCVRDELLGITPADYDVATSATPDQVQSLFRHCHWLGASFGVVEVIGPKVDGEWLKVQVATFRSDGEYTDARRPDSVVYSTPEMDAERRDFTINGIFFDPIANQLIDFVGGQADLQKRLLRAIGEPAARFHEDRLRVLRAVRLAARFELDIDLGTMAAIRAYAGKLHSVSPERVAEELRKILTHPNRSRAFRLLREFGLTRTIFAELAHCESMTIDIQSTGIRTRAEFGEAVLEALNGYPTEVEQPAVGFPLALAAWLVGYGGPAVQGETARQIGKNLRLSNSEIDRIVWLVNHQSVLIDAESLPASRLYPLLVQEGTGDLLKLHYALAVASGQPVSHVEYCQHVMQAVPPEQLNPAPLLSGNDLKAAGFKPGPNFSRWLQLVRDAQLNGELTGREQAIEFVRRLADDDVAN